MTTEKNWENMFAFALPEKATTKVERECCDACKEAREIKCVCKCGGRFHGIKNRENMQPLDKTLGLEKTRPELLGDLGLNLELSGRLALE